MSRRQKGDDLAGMIDTALRLGEFISCRQSWDFVSDLEEVKGRIDGLLAGGQADRAVELYETFLAGCYEKAEEIDDSGGNLGMFSHDLFCCWIKARQVAGRDPAETVREIVGWMNRDKYGFCFDMEADVAAVLRKEGLALFRKHFEDRFSAAFAPFVGQEAKFIYDYPSAVYMTARSLKAIYVARRDVRSYVALCEKTVASPKDCENVARMLKARGRPEKAMAWVERGEAIKDTRRWGNEDSHGKAMSAAKDADLAGFIDLYVETRELDLLYWPSGQCIRPCDIWKLFSWRMLRRPCVWQGHPLPLRPANDPGGPHGSAVSCRCAAPGRLHGHPPEPGLSVGPSTSGLGRLVHPPPAGPT